MAEINIKYDTATRKMVASVDGDSLENVVSANCYKDEYSGNYSVSILSYREDSERKMAFTERITATDKVARSIEYGALSSAISAHANLKVLSELSKCMPTTS